MLLHKKKRCEGKKKGVISNADAQGVGGYRKPIFRLQEREREDLGVAKEL